jgi:hypothetical protein
MRLRSSTLIAAAAAAALALPAVAATPDKGTVSNASPEVKWEGTATGYGVVPANILMDAGGEEPLCPPQACDKFALTVADKGDLTVTAAQRAADNFTELHVRKPDGSIVYIQSEDSKPAIIKIKNAATGEYGIEILTNESADSSGEYDASAKLGSGAKPVVTAPAPPPAATPAPPAQRAPATLTLTTKKASAKRSRKALKVVFGTSQPVTAVEAVLRQGTKTVSRAKIARVDRSGTLVFKLRKGLKPGKYAVAIAARDSSGAGVGLTAPFKVVR